MIGKRVGNWVIDKELGEGGMGKVYLAHEQIDGPPGAETVVAPIDPPRQGALKFLAPELAREPDFVTRFEREIDALRKLKHPNIVEFYEAGRHDGSFYYAMEYVDGPSVEQLLLEKRRLGWQAVLEIMLQVCPALKLAHDHGIIHRDLKPPNLLVTKEGTVKLTDFGVAKIFATQRLTATRAVVGTAEFMSPEQAAGGAITNRSDLYSLGVLMYVLLTGRPLFKAASLMEMLHKHRYARFDPPRAIVPEIPPDLDALVCRLLEKDPDQRPRDALVLSRQLEQIRIKEARKAAGEADPQAGETLAVEGIGKTRGPQPPGPGTIMSQLMRAQLKEMDRPGPFARIVNQPVVLVLALAGVVALLVWGLWPASPEALLSKAERLVENGDFDRASETLDRLHEKHPNHPHAQQVAALRQQIDEGHARRKARQAATGPAAFAAPASEAERFYREAVQLHQSGDRERARLIWQSLIDAFAGVEAEERWVLLAREALKQAHKADLASVEEAIRLAAKEPPEQRTRRLNALLNLYKDRTDEEGKGLRERIQKLLSDQESEPEA